MTTGDDLATAYMPDGVLVDENNRHAAGQLAIAWLGLEPGHRRLVAEYERILNPGKAAAAANLTNSAGHVITFGEAEAILGSEQVRRVLRLRSLMNTDTIPPAMIGRILTRIALGLEEGTAHVKVRACVELARVQGAYIPPVIGGELPLAESEAERLDQAAQDRIVQGALGGGPNLADLLRQRSLDASQDEADANEAVAEVMADRAQARDEAPKPQGRQKFKRRQPGAEVCPTVMPVIGTVPPHLASTDALHAAREKMKARGSG